jgi:hypothetical protein
MSEENSVIFNRNIVLTSSKPILKDDFILRAKELAENIVVFLKRNGTNHLGHIKFITTTNGEDYLQISVLDMDQIPKVEGFLRKAFEKIKITMNIIAFGIKKEEFEVKLTEEIGKLKNYYSAQ